MEARIALQPAGERFRRAAELWAGPIATAVAYYAAAQAAFLVGTLSDRIFAPFWPPNAVLFCALLLAPRRRWWRILGATFPAHALAELQVGMPAIQLAVAFATNGAVAALNATALLLLSRGPPWFGSIRNAVVYIVATAGLNPALVALGGAFVPILGGGSIADFPYFWATWYVGNALASLTLGPIILSWADGGEKPPWVRPLRRQIEPLLFAAALIAACVVSLEVSVLLAHSPFRPAILYLPLPIILWGAVRFGEKGAGAAILILTVVSISLTLRGESPFLAETPERSVVALQLFLFGIAVPTILLSAAVDELRTSEGTTRKLAGSLLKAQDDERRRIARDLHDSTAQNLVAAGLLTRSLEGSVAAPAQEVFGKIEGLLEQSVKELRLVSYVLHPPQLDEGGLGPALSDYAAGFGERSGIDVEMDVAQNLGRLPRGAELALYRVVQEALANVERHSASRKASIRLTRRRLFGRHVVGLAVEDVGRGFARRTGESATSPGRRGLGLDSMRERVQQIGGRLTVRSEPGRTSISAVVPVDD
jgi:signal transduction histidine kinase